MIESIAAPQLSVVLITLNEEARLLHCLQSLPIGCEVIVLDSASFDRTEEIARAFGARVESRDVDDYAGQKNAAVALATRPWILSLDADEVLSPALAKSIAAITNTEFPKFEAYRVRRRLVFQGRTLRFGKAADRPLRLFKRGQGQFVSAIHERLEVIGSTGTLKGELLHFSYADLTDYFARFNRYTSRVAENHFKLERSTPNGVAHWLRPWTEFLYRYVFRFGFLDGYQGYTYALISSLYTFVKYAKLRELYVKKSKM